MSSEIFIRKILELYNLYPNSVIKVYPPEKGYRNSSYRIVIDPDSKQSNELNLIVYKKEEAIISRIKRANAVSNFLAVNGFPARQVVADKNGRSIVKIASGNGERYVCLYNYLPGETIPWEGYTMKHLKLLGRTMSYMHYALRQFPRSVNLPDVTEELHFLLGDMVKYFSKKGVIKAMKRKLNITLDNLEAFQIQYSKLFSLLAKEKDRIPLHMDFVRGNVLFGKNKEEELELTGILDFEKTAYGPAIIDVARTLAFLLVDCKYKKEEKVRKYFLTSG